MKQHLIKNTYAAIVAVFITLFVLPTTAQAQSTAKHAHKNSSGQMPIAGSKAKAAPAKAPTSLPLFENFEGSEIPSGWTIIDADNDERDWQILNSDNLNWIVPKSGKNVICSFSHDGQELAPDNYLITPELSGASEISYWFAMNPKYIDHYQVLASTTGKNTADFKKVLLDEKPTELEKIAADNNQSKWVQRKLQLPAGTKYVAFRHCESKGNNYIMLDDITISKGTAETYNLEIAGKKVTSDNCNNLSVIDGVSGTVKYDPSTKTLTLQNATINAGREQALVSRIEGLTIKLVGTNNLSSSGTTIGITEAVTITGNGATLNVLSETICAIYSNTADITIENCTVNTKGVYGFLTRDDDRPENLIIKNATVTADGKEGSIIGFANLKMIDCSITQPTGAAFDTKEKTVMLNGKRVEGKVVIEPAIASKYDLQIIGKDVTHDNCGDLSVIDGVSGTVKYDPNAKVLTLKNATIGCDNDNAIVSNIENLTIKVIGTNTLTATDNATLSFRSPLTITGGGVLNVKCKTDCAIFANETNLTIDNCTVNAESGAYGIAGKSGSSEKFTIRNATVTAIGTGNGSICDFAELNLKGCNITEPSGATFSSSMHGIVLNGEIVKSKVVIKKDPTAIETPTVDNTAVQGIYTLSGVRLQGELNDLPKGVYIVNGQKVVKQ